MNNKFKMCKNPEITQYNMNSNNEKDVLSNTNDIKKYNHI